MILALHFVLSDSSHGLAGHNALELEMSEHGIETVFINGHDFTSEEMIRAVDMLVGKTARVLYDRHRGHKDEMTLAKRQAEDELDRRAI